MRKVLFVTDDLLAGLPGSFLDRRGIRTRTVEGEKQAAATCSAWHPDVVVLPAPMAALGPQLKAATPNLSIILVGEVPPGAAADSKIPNGAPIAVVLTELGAVLGVRLRHSERLDVDLMARVNPGGDAEPILARVLKLSDSGLLLECESPLAHGIQIGIEFHLPDSPNPMATRGIVVSGDASENRYGVAFAETESASLEAIFVHVEVQTAARAEMTRSSEDE